MSFYTQGTYEVMLQLMPSDYHRINANVGWVGTLGGQNNTYYMHSTNFRYGKVQCGRRE